MKNFFTQLIIVGLVMFGMVQFASAATANLKFYTSETAPKTGEFVELDLKVDGNKKTPYYTYVVNLEYDASKLKFEGVSYGDGWVGVEPDAITNIEKGIVKRTAGYPSGADKLMTVMKYKFKAIAPGKAEVKVTGEAALDGQNNSAELQKKNITLTISGKELTEEIAALKNQNITLNIVGDASFAAENVYQFKVEHVLQNQKETIGTTTVSVFDVNGESVMREDRTFTATNNMVLDFNLPAKSLVAGSYTISAESMFPGQTQNNRISKNVEVTGGDISAIPTDSDNVFVNIGNAAWNTVVNNWIGIVGLIVILGVLKYLSGKFRRYRRYDGR